MKESPKVMLHDYVDFFSGYAFKSDLFNDHLGLPVARIRDVVRGYSETYYSGEYSKQFVINNADILIGMDGEFNIGRWKGGQALLNQRVCKVIVNGKIDERYLFWFLPNALKEIEAKTPFVTVKHLSIKQLRDIEIPLPPLQEQKRIAYILDKADALREKRRQTMAKLDELLQSIFLDMFGDPVTNPKNWDIVEFGTLLSDELRNGQSPSKKGTIAAKVLTLTAITKSFYDAMHVKEAFFDTIPKTKLVDKRDFLICRGNGNLNLVGRAKFPDKDLNDVFFPDTMIAGRINQKKISPPYLDCIWNSWFVRDQIERNARTTNGTYKVNQKVLEKIQIPLPDIIKQENFTVKVKKIDLLRIIFQTQLSKINIFFASLQDRAFRGQL